jgi:hypothetical protein
LEALADQIIPFSVKGKTTQEARLQTGLVALSSRYFRAFSTSSGGLSFRAPSQRSACSAK